VAAAVAVVEAAATEVAVAAEVVQVAVSTRT
jgi:hypothetical protein